MTAPSTQNLLDFVGGTPTIDDAWAETCIDEATGLVDNWVGSWSEHVPDSAHKRAILETAAELFQRRAARNGVASFDSTGDTSPMYAPLDSMRAARRILREYIPVNFA